MINTEASYRLGQQVDYSVGDIVQVHAFGHWYPGEVVKIGRKRIYVRYTTGAGRARVKAVTEAYQIRG